MKDLPELNWETLSFELEGEERMFYPTLEDIYQAFKKRMLREQVEAGERFAKEQKDAFEVLWNGGGK